MEIEKNIIKWHQDMEPASISEAVAITENSWPFCSMQHCRIPFDLNKYNYLENEYFVSGKSAIYQKNGDMLEMQKAPQPYTNRILVRCPTDPSKSSGHVYIEILNATNQYDFEDLWQRIYSWCVQNNHIYIGITSKPCNIAALKKYDPKRYKNLHWPIRAETISSANYSAMEEGAFWDILTQTVKLLRYQDNSPLQAYPLKWWYLAGQSQSGAYLNTYISCFYSLFKKMQLPKLYDGFINLVGVQFSRSLGQESLNLKFQYRDNFQTDIPYLGITCEGDYSLFHQFGAGNLTEHCPPDSNTSESKCRYYEIGGAPHFDIMCPVIPNDAEICRTGGIPPTVSPQNIPALNTFPLREYVIAFLEKLQLWVTEDIIPETIERFERNADGSLKRDSHGNVLGGIRSPYLEVPAAHYIASSPIKKEGATGLLIWMSRKEFFKTYGSISNYMHLFRQSMSKQVKKGWLLPTDGERLSLQHERAILENYS